MADNNKKVSRIPTTRGKTSISNPETKPKPATTSEMKPKPKPAANPETKPKLAANPETKLKPKPAAINKDKQSQLPLPQRPINRWAKTPVLKKSKPAKLQAVPASKIEDTKIPKQPNIPPFQNLEIHVNAPMLARYLPSVTTSTSEETFQPGEDEESPDLIVTTAAPIELHQVVSDPNVEDAMILKQPNLATLEIFEKRLENPETIENVNPPMFTISKDSFPYVITSEEISQDEEFPALIVPITAPVELHEDVSSHEVEDTRIPKLPNLATSQDLEKRLEYPETFENGNFLMLTSSKDDFITLQEISLEEESPELIVPIGASVNLHEDVSDHKVEDPSIPNEPNLPVFQDQELLEYPETIENADPLMFASSTDNLQSDITSEVISQEEEEVSDIIFTIAPPVELLEDVSDYEVEDVDDSDNLEDHVPSVSTSEEISQEEEFPAMIASSEEKEMLTGELKQVIDEYYRNEEKELADVVPVTIDSNMNLIRANIMPSMIESGMVPIPSHFLTTEDETSWARLEDNPDVAPDFKPIVVHIPITLRLKQNPMHPYKYSGEFKISNREDKVLIYKVMVPCRNRYVVQHNYGYIGDGAEAIVCVKAEFSSSKERLEAIDDNDRIIVVISQTCATKLNEDGLKSQWEYINLNLKSSIQTYKIDVKIDGQHVKELASEPMQTLEPVTTSDTCLATEKNVQDEANLNSVGPAVEWKSFSPAMIDQDIAEISDDVDAIFTWGSYSLYAAGMLVVLGLAYRKVQEIAISLPLETESEGGFWSSWIPFIKR